jgi:hypothetical protein
VPQITRALPSFPLDEMRRVPFSSFQAICDRCGVAPQLYFVPALWALRERGVCCKTCPWFDGRWPSILHTTKTAKDAMQASLFGPQFWRNKEQRVSAAAGRTGSAVPVPVVRAVAAPDLGMVTLQLMESAATTGSGLIHQVWLLFCADDCNHLTRMVGVRGLAAGLPREISCRGRRHRRHQHAAVLGVDAADEAPGKM